MKIHCAGLKKSCPAKSFSNPPRSQNMPATNGLPRISPTPSPCPRSAKSVSTILRFANRHNIPVTPRGAGYGYVGGCVPVRGGIALSLERMNRILEINPRDFVAVVQPGVNTAEFQEAVRKARAFLSARSRQPREQFHRRQHRHQRRRPALLEIRRHPRLRPRPRSRPGRRHHRPARRTHAQKQNRLRSAPAVRRLGRPARRRHRGDVETASAAAVPRQPGRRLQLR